MRIYARANDNKIIFEFYRKIVYNKKCVKHLWKCMFEK